MKKKLILITNYKFDNKNLNKFFFWNRFHSSIIPKKFNKFDNKLNYLKDNSILNYSKQNRKKDYIKCENIYQSILKDLVSELNKLHGVKKSKKYWEIILSHWLKRFIYICYNNFKILNKKTNFTVITSEYGNDSLFTSNTCDLRNSSNSYSWNFILISKMLKYFRPNLEFIYKKKSNKKYNSLTNLKKKYKLKNLILNIANLIFRNFYKNKDVFFYNSGLPFFFEKNLEIRLGQYPRFSRFKDFNYLIKKFDYNFRTKLNLKKKNKISLEDFIRQQLPLTLPGVVIESFSNFLKLTRDESLPKKPSHIITAYDFDCNDFFKIYTAEKVEKKTKYVILQHGNRYFTSIEGKFYPEMKICDKFISWGPKENKKHFPFFNINVLNKNHVSCNKEGGLTIITNFAGWRYWVHDTFDEACLSSESTVNLINSLDKEIKQKSILKLFPTNNFLDEYIYENYFKKIQIKKIKNINFFKLHKKTRLFWFTYDSTGIMQNLSLNIPTVAYWKDITSNINTKYLRYYKLLIEAKIIFEKKEDLINHINLNWSQINYWWFDKYTQDKISLFNKNLNNSINKEKINKLIKYLN